MGLQPLNTRIQHLLASQNPDGGWGHYPGQVSWLEPTVYGVFALWQKHHDQAAKALALVRGWQRPDGAFRPCAAIDEPHWATSLVINVAQGDGNDPACQKALDWLLEVQGAEGGLVSSFLKRFIVMPADQNEELHGWPWRPGTSSWVEPTAHAMVTLKKSHIRQTPAAQRRIAMAEGMIADRRSEDGGWNYGNRKVYNVPVPSYPETTGLALLALQDRANLEFTRRQVELMWRARPKGLARAWLAIAMQCHGWIKAVEEEMGAELPPGGDLTMTALEAIGLQPEIVEARFRTGGRS